MAVPNTKIGSIHGRLTIYIGWLNLDVEGEVIARLECNFEEPDLSEVVVEE